MAGRRGNGEGSITYRPAQDRWEARISLESGKRKSFYGRTRQEVARKLTEALRDRDRGLPVVGEKQTVGQYAESWLQSIRPTIGPTTILKYEREVRLRFVPAFGKTSLARLSAQQVQVLYASCLEKGLTGTTVHHTHAVLHKMLSDALRLGLVQRNVCDLVDAPRMEHHEMMVYTPDEARRFLQTVRDHRLEALYVLALSTGMRQGELLALKWRDVDTEGCVVQVRTTLKYVKGQYLLTSA